MAWGTWRSVLAREPLRSAAILALAATAAAAVAMFMAKAAWIASLSGSASEGGISDELSTLRLLSWFARDLLAAAIWGLLVGLMCGLWRRRYARLAGNLVLALLCLGLAVALFLSVYVYAFWGTPPTWQLLQSLDDPGNATDSVAAMMTTGRALWLGSFALVLVAGTFALRRQLDSRPGAARYLAVSMALCAALLSVAATTAPASRFELERNPLLAFVASATLGQSYEAAVEPVGSRTELFRAVADPQEPKVPREYGLLRRWARERPNVVLVILETMAARHLQLTGGPVDNTPTLVSLAERGILWPRHYAHTPSSMFAIYQVLCSNHGTPQGPQISRTRPRIDCRSLSEILTASGYRAGLFHSGRHSYSRKDVFFAGRGYDVLYDTQSMPNRERYRETSWGIEERASIDAMVDWIQEDRSKPFFVTYIPVYPHHPYPVPEPKYKKYPGRGVNAYRSSVYYVDQMMGELLQELRDIEAYDDTLFVFVGDHGEGFGEHPGSRMHGSKLYDEAVKTFALWYAPGAVTGGLRDERPFGHVDIAPTLLELLHMKPAQQHVGTSALWSGARPMVPLYTGYGNPLVGFIDGRYKFIHNRRNGHSELYDLLADPGERTNLKAKQPAWMERYELNAAEFVGFQKSWEDALPDLVEELEPLRGRTHYWVVDPATCELPKGHFAVRGGRLVMVKGGEVTVFCRTQLPPGVSAVTGLTVRGTEKLGASFITTMAVWHAPNGRRRQVAHCYFNGRPKKAARSCEAEIAPSIARIDGGGEMVMELRYVASGKDLPFDEFGVAEVELALQMRD